MVDLQIKSSKVNHDSKSRMKLIANQFKLMVMLKYLTKQEILKHSDAIYALENAAQFVSHQNTRVNKQVHKIREIQKCIIFSV